MKKVASIVMMMFFLTPCLFTISYADDVTTVEAYNMVCDNTNVYIVDVRTDAEWMPIRPGRKYLLGNGSPRCVHSTS